MAEEEQIEDNSIEEEKVENEPEIEASSTEEEEESAPIEYTKKLSSYIASSLSIISPGYFCFFPRVKYRNEPISLLSHFTSSIIGGGRREPIFLKSVILFHK